MNQFKTSLFCTEKIMPCFYKKFIHTLVNYHNKFYFAFLLTLLVFLWTHPKAFAENAKKDSISISPKSTSIQPQTNTLTEAPAENLKLKDKIRIVEKKMNSDLSFEKKTVILKAMKKWVDQQVQIGDDKLTENQLTELMQYSNLLKSAQLSKLTPKNCIQTSQLIIEEDVTPLSDDLSAPAKVLLNWFKLLCKKK